MLVQDSYSNNYSLKESPLYFKGFKSCRYSFKMSKPTASNSLGRYLPIQSRVSQIQFNRPPFQLVLVLEAAAAYCNFAILNHTSVCSRLHSRLSAAVTLFLVRFIARPASARAPIRPRGCFGAARRGLNPREPERARPIPP